jgi:hypothetical protein
MMELMFYLTSRARAYPEATLRRWLGEAGFARIDTVRLVTAPMTVLLTARRPLDPKQAIGERVGRPPPSAPRRVARVHRA